MCQAIIRYCSDSARPILISGSVLTLLAALGLGYVSYTSNALYEDIDKTITQEHLSTKYYLQLLAAGYLILVTVLGCLAANYDQKHSIRALSIISSINFVLAVVAIVLIAPANQPSKLFQVRIQDAQGKYEYGTNYTVPSVNTTVTANSRRRRWAQEQSAAKSESPKQLTPEAATILLDRLQERGCCVKYNTTDNKFPKSCCARSAVLKDGNDFVCKMVDDHHNQSCITLIDSTQFHLIAVLALTALANFYLAIVSGIRAYKTLPYVEASQNAYS